ncbi:MAG: NAD(+) synthase, partial [Rhodococcus ruber]|nr:NAD(+) synthase [Rhodococcus ruber]
MNEEAGPRDVPDTEARAEFRSSYRHGFLRVAACATPTAIVDPAANAATVLRAARVCHDDGVGLAVFPERTLTGDS